MSPSKQRRTRAYGLGQLHAQGGEDMSDHFTGDDLEAYRRGEADAEAFMAQERAYHDNPLRKMQGRARQLNEESDNQDVAALADLVDDLLLHMLNKEEGLI